MDKKEIIDHKNTESYSVPDKQESLDNSPQTSGAQPLLQQRPNHQGQIIAFDFGTKRIGVAVGQGVTETATPLFPLSAKNGVPRWELIEEIVETWRPQALVVGLPLKSDGTDQPLTKLVRCFIEELKNRTKLPVYEVDELLSTKEARSRLFEEGGYSALQKNSIDCFAAKVILEDWFSRTKTS